MRSSLTAQISAREGGYTEHPRPDVSGQLLKKKRLTHSLLRYLTPRCRRESMAGLQLSIGLFDSAIDGDVWRNRSSTDGFPFSRLGRIAAVAEYGNGWKNFDNIASGISIDLIPARPAYRRPRDRNAHLGFRYPARLDSSRSDRYTSGSIRCAPISLE